MMYGDVAGLLHPVRKHGITGRCEDGHSSQHQILAEGHLNQFSVVSSQCSDLLEISWDTEDRELSSNPTFRPRPRVGRRRPVRRASLPSCCARSAVSGTCGLPCKGACVHTHQTQLSSECE